MRSLNPIYSFISYVALFLIFCSHQVIPSKNAGQWQEISLQTTYNQKVFSVPILIYTPKNKSVPQGGYPLMIALHGWNLKMKEWQTQSGISHWADKYNVLIVCPEMGKANYEYEYFPETTMKWQPKPSGPWIYEDLYQYIKKHYPITSDRMKTGVMGVSTGGHGAALLAGYYPETFGFASSISGDFDLPKMPTDKLSIYIFGTYDSFPERWQKGSSIHMLDKMKQSRIYIAHGTRDRIAPVIQSQLMANALKQSGIESLYTENHEAGHDWNYWKTEVGPTMEFFMKGK